MFGESPQAAHPGPAAYRPSQLVAVAAAEAEAAVTAAVQHLRLGQTAAEPEAGPAATSAAAAAPPANTAAPKPVVEPVQQQQDAGAGGGLGYTTVVGPDGELWVPDS